MSAQLVARTGVDYDSQKYFFYVKQPKDSPTWQVMRKDRKTKNETKVACFQKPPESSRTYLYYVKPDGNVYRTVRKVKGQGTKAGTKISTRKVCSKSAIPDEKQEKDKGTEKASASASTKAKSKSSK